MKKIATNNIKNIHRKTTELCQSYTADFFIESKVNASDAPK